MRRTATPKHAMTPLLRKSIATDLKKAWAARFEQNLEETARIARKLRKKLGYAGDLNETANEVFPFVAEVLLIEASLARADQDLRQSQLISQEVERAYRFRRRPLPAPLYLQKGLNSMSESEHSAALEQFLGARSVARNSQERFWALGNALICIETLGLPFGQTLSEFKMLAKTLRLGEASLSQIAGFEARQALREGRIADLSAPNSFRSIQQIHYFRLWAAALPTISVPESRSDRALKDFVFEGRGLYLHAYRARTLQSVWHEEDGNITRWNDIAQRLYLWTWRWLVRPEAFSFSLIEPILQQIASGGALFGKLSAEDFQLIRNALSWIAFLDQDAETDLNHWLQAHRPSYGEDFPLYGLEFAAIKKLSEAKARKRSLESLDLQLLSLHPLWKASALTLPGLMRSVAGCHEARLPLPLREFARRIVQSLDAGGGGHACRVTVDLTTSQIVFADPRIKPIISTPIARALALLSRHPTVSYAEFVQSCFGFYRYDPVIHDLKILNLLARIRAFLPRNSRVGVKSGAIRSNIGSDVLTVLEVQPHLHTLRHSEAWRKLLGTGASTARQATRQTALPALLLHKLEGRTEVTRRELENWTGKSRATGNRWINQLIEQGALQRMGAARDTRYRITLGGET